MKTNELIKALSRDATVAPPPQRTLGLNLACGAVLALPISWAVTRQMVKGRTAQ